MFAYIVRRMFQSVIVLLVVGLVAFSMFRFVGDPIDNMLGQERTQADIDRLRSDLGLDQPIVTRYFDWLIGAAQGDFGTSFAQANFSAFAGDSSISNFGTVAAQLAPRFANTIFLAGVTAAIAVPLSLSIGILAALYRQSVFDRIANVSTLTSISSPEFFVAYILILVLAVLNPVLPSLSNIFDGMSFAERLEKTLLPALTLTLVVTAHMMRMTRAAIINLLASPYIEMARLKGLSPFRVIVVHALPNALAPIINVVALNLAYWITGVVVVEAVFVYPGLGQLLVDSVAKRDITMVQACCLIFAAAYVLLNMLADIFAIATNPRLLHPK